MMDRSKFEKYPQPHASKKTMKNLMKRAFKYNRRLHWKACAFGYGVRAFT